MDEIKNQLGHGLDLEKEKADRKAEDWIFGVSAPLTGFGEGIKFKDYLPMGETQRGREDVMDCATRSPENQAEGKFTYAYRVGIIKGFLRKWLEDNGYVVDNRVTFSDAFNAIKSNTMRNGNSLIAPLDSIHRDGLIPKQTLPLEKWMTWADYHNKTRITQKMTDLGLEFLKYFTINYERVLRKDFNKVIDKDMIGIAGYAWPTPVNGEYPRVENTPNHAFVYFEKPPYEIFDNYPESEGDYIKNLASDYNLLEYGYRVICNIRTYEITTEQCRYAYSLFQEIADAFPAANKFYSPTEPTYSIYDWAREWGKYHHPEIFMENNLDWTKVDGARRAEAEWLTEENIDQPEVKKKNLWKLIIDWFLNLWR